MGMNYRLPTFVLLLLAFVLGLPAALPTPATAQAVAQALPNPLEPGLFGLNMYITGRERREREARRLVSMGRQMGAAWSREEISWATWGNSAANSYYDERIRMLTDAGFNMIGMLLTTPEAYRDPACVAHAKNVGTPDYWCAPTDLRAYAAWAAQVVERYDGDGYNDAPGSPRIAAWEIWNEPDIADTWLPAPDPVRYGEMLRLASTAIKQADPTALVLNGGVMTFDAIGVDAFMDQVVQVAGWDSFDVLSLHPWLIDHAPDAPYLINPRENFDVTLPGRLAMAQRWIERNGGGKPIWITEIGWSTCGAACEAPFARSYDEQADYLVRTFVLAAAAGVQHVNYFQLEDKFNGKQQPWGPAALLHDDFSPKPAYHAFRTLATELHAAQYAGVGALHLPGVRADHRFTLLDGGSLRVLWRITGREEVTIPLDPAMQAVLIRRDGETSALGGSVAQLTLSEQPVYLRQTYDHVLTFAEVPHDLRGGIRQRWEAGGGVPVFGFPLTPVMREQRGGGTYATQWFERARIELHPQNPPPYDVLLGLLGIEALERQGIAWHDFPTLAPEQVPAACAYFAETRHSLCPPFRAYWEADGGIARAGLPISEPFTEWRREGRNDVPYIVQYFERTRLEYRPDLPEPFTVQSARLGAELMP